VRRSAAPLRGACAAALAVVLSASACSLAPIDLAAEKPLALRSTITDAAGGTLARLFEENRAYVPLRRLPPVLVDAVLAAEDARFFEHPGFDAVSIARAAIVNAREGDVVQGGSTITQQYVKNAYFPRPDRTLERKARELRLAIEMERRYSKREILERYLNTVYLGDGAYGVKAAAESFFGHGVGDTNLAEAALIAALIKSPAGYDPRSHPKRALIRRNYILDRMAKLGLVSEDHAARAKTRPLGVTRTPPRIPSRQPYFVEAVKREILGDRRLGADEDARARALWRGGLQVETTLEPRLQAAAERAVDAILGRRGDPAAALVAIRPRTGEIVAMVGGRSWKASQVNLALGRAGGGSGRQPGSAFKPIALAAALESGMRIEDRYEAGPASFTFDDGTTWSVGNNEGSSTGLISLYEATVHSVNAVFARLSLAVGPDRIATQAALMGVRSKLGAHPSIALGAEEVSVLDMAAAYATLANHGTAVEPTTIKSIGLPTGGHLGPDQDRIESAVSPGAAYLITTALQDVITRGTGRAAAIGRPAAGKTGTSNDYADAWFVGYTPDLVAAVWVGYPEGRIPMTSVHGIRVLGGTYPAAIWRTFMTDALAGTPPKQFRLPRRELVRVEIDPDSGLLAAPWCPGKMQTMLRQEAPTRYCPPPPPPVIDPVVPEVKKERANERKKDEDARKKEEKAEGKPKPKPKPSPKPEPKPTPKPNPTPTG